MTRKLNEGKNEIISICYYYLTEEIVQYKIQEKVPNIVLLTVNSRTSKIYIIHILLQIGYQNKTQNEMNTEINSVWIIAINNLNAVDIDRSTIASLLRLKVQKN